MSLHLSQKYDELVVAGALHRDDAQIALLPELERISSALNLSVKRGLFRKAPEPPKGLYLWGGVGTGKSMLMDLFVDTIGDIPVRRVHFHAFMQEMHAAMHAARQRGDRDVIAPVAAAVAEDIRLDRKSVV